MYNQKSDLLAVDTAISKHEDKGTQILITDSGNNYYSFFKTKQDGSPTAAANTFALASSGQPVTIVYKEVPYKGKTLRSVVKFRLREAQKPNPTTPRRRGTVESAPVETELEWFKQNHAASWAGIFAKIKTAYLAAHPSQPSPTEDINVEDIPF